MAFRFPVHISALAASLAVIQAASAQTAPQPAAVAAGEQAAAPETGVADIVVTSERRAERLQDVPVSVTALSAQDLEERGAKTIEDVARTTPGLVVTPSALGSGSQPTIRGISSAVGAATVGAYIDDTPLQIRPTPFAGNPDLRLFDIDRVEVLRGPQGTLFGASSEGGTIRYITPQPNFDHWESRFRAEGAGLSSGDADYEFGGAAGGPIADGSVAGRASAFFRHDGGYVDRVSRLDGTTLSTNVNGTDTQAYRLQLEARPTDSLRISPAVFYQRTDISDLPLFEANRFPDDEIRQRNTVREPGKDEFVLPSLTVNYDFGFATLTSVTSTFYRDDRQILDYSTVVPNLLLKTDFVPGFTQNYLAYSDNLVRQQTVTQEVRLTSNGDGPVRWIGGFFYNRSKETFAQSVPDLTIDSVFRSLLGVPFGSAVGPLLPGSLVFQSKQADIETQIAGFGEVDYEVLPKLTLTAGLRVSGSSLDFTRVANGALNGGPNSIAGSQNETPVTPKFGASYKLDEDDLLYFTAQRGFRVGGVNNAIPLSQCAADIRALGGNPPQTFNSDSLWSYEAGVKSELANRRIQINADVYRIDWDNIQQLLALPTCGFGYTDNLGSARSQGFELEAQWRPVNGLTLGVRTGYVDARFTTDDFSASNPATGARAVIARAGDLVPGVPDWTVSWSGEYSAALSDTTDGYFRADYQYVGNARRTLPQGSAGYVASTFFESSYDYASLRAGVLLADGLDVSLFVNNLGDSRPILGATTNTSPVAGTIRATTLRPRQVGLTVSARF